MKYKITIRKCADPGRAQEIALGIAKWSGSSPDVVLKVIVEKPVCIKREAEEEEALRIKSQFEAYGAEVDLIPLQEEEFALSSLPPTATVAAPVAARAAAPTQYYSSPMPQKRVQQPVQAQNSSWDDDEEEEEGRLLTDEEFTELLKRRPDIFYFDTSSRLRNMTLISVLLGMGFGFWMTHVEFVNIATDFYEKLPEERTAKFVTAAELPKTLEAEKKEEKKKEADIQTEDKKRLKPKPTKGGGGTSGGGGDPRARVTQKGVLGIVSGAVKGKTVASADIFGKGGFATGIDAIISGTGGLKSGGSGGTGRRGVAGIGYGAGYGSGFGGSGSGGVDDLIGNLMGGNGGGLNLKKKGALKLKAPDFIKGGSLTGGRSRASIQRVVMQNMAALRYAYNKRLRDKPGLTGKITVKWAIDEFGKVLFAQVVESTINDSELEIVVKEKIMRWVFDKIDKPGDVTECVYPFVFSN